MTTFDDLVAQLRGARATLLADRERLDGELGRLDAAITALDGATTVALIPSQVPAPAVSSIKARPGEGNGLAEIAAVPVKAKPAAERGTTTIDYAAVAAWIKAAKADGTYTQQRMADHFGKPVSTVKNWPNACRGLGLLEDGDLQRSAPVAHPTPPVVVAPAKPTGKPVLRCTDCGWECGVDKAQNLDLHCRGTHRRPATTAERTPVAAA